MLIRREIFLTLLAQASVFAFSHQQICPETYSPCNPCPTTPTAPPHNTVPPIVSRLNDQPLPQPNQLSNNESQKQVSRGAERFALELLTKFSDVIHDSGARDFMISPISIWSLFLLLTEGAGGKTERELRSTLHIGNDQQAIRQQYRMAQEALKVNTSTIEVASLQALFSDSNTPPNPDYEKIVENIYGADFYTTDFTDINATFALINDKILEATRGLIRRAVNPQDLNSANFLMLSTLFFKGQWKKPFNESLTRPESFYDEQGNDIGKVDMMVQVDNFIYAGINELEGHVLELPYGEEDQLSMLVILPKKGVSINKVVHNLQEIGVQLLFDKLAMVRDSYEDEEVEVFLPKFETVSGFTLNVVMQALGVLDLFDPNRADLSKISERYFVSSMLHHTKIIVNERGTIAAAATQAVLANKATPPKFYLNRPFLYLIMEKKNNVMLFAGQVANPNNYKY